MLSGSGSSSVIRQNCLTSFGAHSRSFQEFNQSKYRCSARCCSALGWNVESQWSCEDSCALLDAITANEHKSSQSVFNLPMVVVVRNLNNSKFIPSVRSFA